MLFERFNLDVAKLEALGRVGVLASFMAIWTERAIWSVESVDPAGSKHWTDGKQISQLIERLDKRVAGSGDARLATLIAAWCKAAEPANKCRNSIVHGMPMSLGGEWLNFDRNVP